MMIWKTTIFGLLLCVVVDGGPATSEQKIVTHKRHHGDLKHVDDKKPEHHDEYAWSYPSYEFSYKVKDPHTHDEKGQREARHGDEVRGEYWLIEPDGRKRTVHYRAEKHTGFHATVKYSGPLHHIRHKSKDEHKKHDKAVGLEGGDEKGSDGEEGRGGDEGRGGEEDRKSDKSHVGEKDKGGDKDHKDDDKKHGDELKLEHESKEKQDEYKNDDFWSLVGFGKKDEKKKGHGKKHDHGHHKKEKVDEAKSGEEDKPQDDKHGGLFGYEWEHKYNKDHEGLGGEEDKGQGNDGKDDSKEIGSGGEEDSGRDSDGKKDRKGGRKGDENRSRGSDGKKDKKGGRGDGKGRGHKGKDREGLSSYHIPMPYPKRIENFDARAYSHGRYYRDSPVHRQ